MLEVLFKIAEDKRLHLSCLHVALALTKHRGALGYNDLIAATHLSEQTVRRSVEALRKAGYAETSPAPKRHILTPVETRTLREVWESSSDEARTRLLEELSALASDDDEDDESA